jgi:F-type H+-transporting ATPase subunit b
MKRIPTWLTACGGIAMLSRPVWAEEAKGSLPQLDVQFFPGLLFWLAVSFPLLFVLMRFLAVPRVLQTKARRQHVLRTDLEAAETDNEQAHMLRAALEKAIADARAKAQETVSGMATAAAEEEAEKRAAQQQELSRRVTEAEARLEDMRKDALKDVSKAADDLAAAMAEKLIGQKA